MQKMSDSIHELSTMWKGAKGIYEDYYIILDAGTYISTDDIIRTKNDEIVITGIDSDYNVYVFHKRIGRGCKYTPMEFIKSIMQMPDIVYVQNKYMQTIAKNRQQ
jgi:hypothetical protein